MLVTGAADIAHRYLAERLPGYVPDLKDPAILAVKGGEILGACAYQNFRGTNIEMSCAGEPGWLSRGNIAGFLWYPFEQLGVRRVTVLVHRKNKVSRRFVERIGWKLEGVLRKAAEDGRDLMVYGLLREEAERHLSHHTKTEWVSYGQIIA